MFLILLLSFLPAVAEDWDAAFKEVCAIGGPLCQRLKSSEGVWNKPKPEVLAMMRDPEIQKQVQEVAKKYNVDPVAVSGAIVAENSLNVGVKDSIQTFIASKMGITKIGNKSFSFGLGQINLSAGREAENYLARIENRAPMSDADLIKDIADPLGSIRVAGTIIRKVQDDYKAQGFDISKDPGILTSLYNLGHSEQRALQTKQEGRTPQVNYFGLFVQKYKEDIESTFVSANAVSSPSPAERKSKQISSLPAAGPRYARRATNLEQVSAVSESIPLASSPMFCGDPHGGDYGQNDREKMGSISYGAPVGIIAKNQSYTEISRALDCDTRAWKLIQSETGKSGWVQTSQLDAVTVNKLASVSKRTEGCRSEDSNTCAGLINSKLGENLISVENSKLIYAKPIAASGSNASFIDEDRDCGFKAEKADANSAAATKTQAASGPRSSKQAYGISQMQTIGGEEGMLKANELVSLTDRVLDRMKQATELRDNDLLGPENPYAQIASWLQSAKNQNNSCRQNLLAENASCMLLEISDSLKNQIENMKFEKEPNVNKLVADQTNFFQALQRETSNSFVMRKPSIAEKHTAKEIREALDSCLDRLKTLSVTNAEAAVQAQGRAGSMASSNTQFPGNNGSGMGMWAGGVSSGYGGGYGGNGSFNSSSMPMVGQGSAWILNEISSYKTNLEKTNDTELVADQKYGSYASYCHQKFNMLKAEESTNPIICSMASRYVIGSDGRAISSRIMAGIYQNNPELLQHEIISPAAYIFGTGMQQGQSSNVAVRSRVGRGQVSAANGSYCPQKTAEMIADLIKKYPCIQNVYVPTVYLSKKLAEQGGKVIYRAFEGDDRWAIELEGNGQCK